MLTRLEAQRSLDKTSRLAEVQSWDVSRREDVQIYQHTRSMQTVHTLQPFTADTEVHSQTRFLIDQVNCMVAYPFWHWQPGGIKHNYVSTRPYVGQMARTIHQPKPRRLSVQSRSSMQPQTFKYSILDAVPPIHGESYHVATDKDPSMPPSWRQVPVYF